MLHLNECGEHKGRNISAVYDRLVHSSLLADLDKTNTRIFLKKNKLGPYSHRGWVQKEFKDKLCATIKRDNKEERRSRRIWSIFLILTSHSKLANLTGRGSRYHNFYRKLQFSCAKWISLHLHLVFLRLSVQGSSQSQSSLFWHSNCSQFCG